MGLSLEGAYTWITQISEKKGPSEGRERWANLWKGLTHGSPKFQRKRGLVRGGKGGLISGRGLHMDHPNF